VRIEWVHPTWRDLVIGMLIDDERARRHFLRRCGVHGLELALSTAGGAAGERTLPLIRTDQDWDALTDRLYVLVTELEPQDVIAALAALSAALDHLSGEPEATALADTVLSRTAVLWNASRKPIAIDLLDSWLSLGALLDPRPTPPELSVTWAGLLPTRTPRRDDRVAIERFADWLVLCQLLRDYDHQLLEQLGFSADQLALALAFALDLERHPGDISPAAEDATLRAIDCIARLAPEYAALPRTLGRRLRRGVTERSEVQRLSQRELEREFGDLGPLDVDRVLADL
jgi:hypothetical protein